MSVQDRTQDRKREYNLSYDTRDTDNRRHNVERFGVNAESRTNVNMGGDMGASNLDTSREIIKNLTGLYV